MIYKNLFRGLLNLCIFRKLTHTDKYLNFNSNHPIDHKNNVVRSLINKANAICDPQNVEEISYVTNVLKLNDYNNKIIDKISKEIKPIYNNEPNDFKYVSVTYIRGTSERTARYLHTSQRGHKREN